MPTWLISFLLPMALSFARRYGIPALEADFPKLKPLIEAVLSALGQGSPTVPLQSAAEHYNSLAPGAQPNDLKS